MKIIALYDSSPTRIVERYLWLPTKLRIPSTSEYRLKWLTRARIVQVWVTRKSGRGADWVDRCFVEDLLQRADAVHALFGLSYASWLCWPRVLMERMPLECQLRFCNLWEEFADQWEWIPEGASIYVQFKDESGKYMHMPRELCQYRHPDEDFIESLRRKT